MMQDIEDKLDLVAVDISERLDHMDLDKFAGQHLIAALHCLGQARALIELAEMTQERALADGM